MLSRILAQSRDRVRDTHKQQEARLSEGESERKGFSPSPITRHTSWGEKEKQEWGKHKWSEASEMNRFIRRMCAAPSLVRLSQEREEKWKWITRSLGLCQRDLGTHYESQYRATMPKRKPTHTRKRGAIKYLKMYQKVILLLNINVRKKKLAHI